jgi:hypothetical protein
MVMFGGMKLKLETRRMGSPNPSYRCL